MARDELFVQSPGALIPLPIDDARARLTGDPPADLTPPPSVLQASQRQTLVTKGAALLGEHTWLWVRGIGYGQKPVRPAVGARSLFE